MWPTSPTTTFRSVSPRTRTVYLSRYLVAVLVFLPHWTTWIWIRSPATRVLCCEVILTLKQIAMMWVINLISPFQLSFIKSSCTLSLPSSQLPQPTRIALSPSIAPASTTCATGCGSSTLVFWSTEIAFKCNLLRFGSSISPLVIAFAVSRFPTLQHRWKTVWPVSRSTCSRESVILHSRISPISPTIDCTSIHSPKIECGHLCTTISTWTHFTATLMWLDNGTSGATDCSL